MSGFDPQAQNASEVNGNWRGLASFRLLLKRSALGDQNQTFLNSESKIVMGNDFGSLEEPIENTQKRVRLAARALARHNLVHAYGHVSARPCTDMSVCMNKVMSR